MNIHNQRVSIQQDLGIVYPEYPYAPAHDFPEVECKERNRANTLYPAFRNLMFNLGLDSENFNKPQWNPFKRLISRGQTVFVKPNWVRHYNPPEPDSIDSLVTHTSLLRVVLDYILVALCGRGRVIIGDAPVQDCDLNALLKRNRTLDLLETYTRQFPGTAFEIMDLRKTILKRRLPPGAHALEEEYQEESEGDPHAYSLIDLAKESMLVETDRWYKRYRVTCYDHQQLRRHQNPDKHEYYISNSLLNADCIINLPKLKTHIKSGFTGALKNFIGANGHKEFLAHHSNGCPSEGGDQYPHKSVFKPLYNIIYDRYWSCYKAQSEATNRLQKLALRFLKRCSSSRLDRDNCLEGSWYGNHTVARTTLDVANVMYFYDSKTRNVSREPARRIVTFVDGVVAGEGRGPLRPSTVRAGVLIGGFNPLLIDCVIGQLVGFDVGRIQTLVLGFKQGKFLAEDYDLGHFHALLNGRDEAFFELPNLRFCKPRYWDEVARCDGRP